MPVGAGWPRLGGLALVPVNLMVDATPACADRLDPESAEWLRALAGTSPQRDVALARLHAMLVRIARREVARRGTPLPVTGTGLEDLACQAAADALMAITGRIGQFRGEGRFRTWACKFVIFEVSAKIGQHCWRRDIVPFEDEDWDRLPDRLGLEPGQEVQGQDLLAVLRRAVDTELTPRQRDVFVAVDLYEVPLDALAAEFALSRNAIYTMLFDARRKLRAALAADGYLDHHALRPS